ncbi:MAG: (Fe-S)-binding protein [Dehalococcoidia bacterium]|nr:(Fe-S)-binding protein [Dehalococcoidia bacterium]
MTTKRSKLAESYDATGNDFAGKCTNCGLCLEACPAFPFKNVPGIAPGAVMEGITGFLKGGPITKEASRTVQACAGNCRACATACPEGLKPQAAFVSAVIRLASSQGLPIPDYIKPGYRLNFGNAFRSMQIKPREERWMMKAPANPEPVDLVWFGGCNVACMPHMLLETVSILESMQIKFVGLVGGEICCGGPSTMWGHLELLERFGKDLVTNIAAFRPKMAIFSCPSCCKTISGSISRIADVPFESRMLNQFLVDNLDRIPLRHKVNRVVTLHDSCNTVHNRTYEHPRSLLKAIPGLTLVEMAHNRDNALCCGGRPEATSSGVFEARRRMPLKEAAATGADTLATNCSGCQRHFVPLEDQYRFEIRNYISLVAEAVGVREKDRFKPLIHAGNVNGALTAANDCFCENGYTRKELERPVGDYFSMYVNNLHAQAP